MLSTAKLICVFVFANAQNRFSHDAALIGLQFSVMRTITIMVYRCKSFWIHTGQSQCLVHLSHVLV